MDSHTQSHVCIIKRPLLSLMLLLALPASDTTLFAADPAPPHWIAGKAFALPKHTTSEGSGYFSIVEGKNGRIYIGTAKYQENAYLVEFSPHEKDPAQQMRVVLDAHKEIGITAADHAMHVDLGPGEIQPHVERADLASCTAAG